MKLTDFDTLTFDCYGTLIDWETGLFAALQPLRARAGLTLGRDGVLEVFAAHESAQQAATPDMRYVELLATVHNQLARLWGVSPDAAEDQAFGASVPDWPAFPDTPAALRSLQQHYKLVILSNVDRDSFQGSLPRLGVTFDAIYTAQDIGSYKPDPRNFRYLIERLAAAGTPREKILHTAQSLFHDHAPANAAGLASAWIDRRHATPGHGATATPPQDVRWDFRFTSLGEMAEARQEG
ncbi:MAG: haloacid dehalogenase type II [Acetobacteraceae bacterium]|nr:haloacid dehalogenase type II [Acetobacteraceae bacterium]